MFNFFEKRQNQNIGKHPNLWDTITATMIVSEKDALWDCNQTLRDSAIFPEGTGCYREQ